MKKFLNGFSILLVANFVCNLRVSSAIQFKPGDFYATVSSEPKVRHYDRTGEYLDTLELGYVYGENIKGITFGPDGLLYAVIEDNTVGGFSVIAFNETGVVRGVYWTNISARGNQSFGKVTFGGNGKFFVSAGSNVVEFSVGTFGGTLLYHEQNPVFDTKELSSANLLVLSSSAIREISPTGTVVRTIVPSAPLIEGRGLEYDPVRNDIFVSTISGIMRIDGTTGFVKRQQLMNYGDGIVRTDDNRLIVGSPNSAPAVYDLDLNPLGYFGNERQYFLTQMPVPEPSSLLLSFAGCAALLRRKRV